MNPLNLIIKPASVYRFAELLTMPYTQYESYNAKIINDKGKIISEQGSMDGLEYVAIRLRSMFKELMPGSTQYFLRSLSGTLKLFNEEFSRMGMTIDDINVAIEHYLLSETQGEVSYLDYLLEEATQRYITEEMTSGGEGGLATPANTTKQGGIAGVDSFLITDGKKKKKKFKEIVSEAAKSSLPPAPKPPKTIGLEVDPVTMDELGRSMTPTGHFDPSQLTNKDAQRYFGRFIETLSDQDRVYAVGGDMAPLQLRIRPKKKKGQSDKNTLP